MKSNKRIEPFLYLVPSVLLLCTFWAFPLINTIRYSFSLATISRGIMGFVGLRNYQALFSSPDFWATLQRTVIWLIGSVPPAILLGFIGALILNQNIIGKNVFRMLAFIPWVIPPAVVGVVWMWTVHPYFGLVNKILLRLGLLNQPKSFLTYEMAMFTIIMARIWRATAFSVVTFLGGLQSISDEIIDASKVDGANFLQRTLRVIMPLLRPIFISTSLVLVIWSTTVFDTVWVMTGGGPVDATKILAVDIYQKAFSLNNAGLASATAVIGLILLAVFSSFYYKIAEKEVR